MAESKPKALSPLVTSVLALDGHFSELERLGSKINSLDMKSEFDFDQAQKLLPLFAECGQNISAEMSNLAQQLNAARERAEEVAAGVSSRADLLNNRKTEENEKLEQFRQLGEKVRALSVEINHFKRPEGVALSDAEKNDLATALARFELQLSPLIEEAQSLRKDAQTAKMRFLEQNADSLTQTLQAIRQKLSGMNLSAH